MCAGTTCFRREHEGGQGSVHGRRDIGDICWFCACMRERKNMSDCVWVVSGCFNGRDGYGCGSKLDGQDVRQGTSRPLISTRVLHPTIDETGHFFPHGSTQRPSTGRIYLRSPSPPDQAVSSIMFRSIPCVLAPKKQRATADRQRSSVVGCHWASWTRLTGADSLGLQRAASRISARGACFSGVVRYSAQRPLHWQPPLHSRHASPYNGRYGGG